MWLLAPSTSHAGCGERWAAFARGAIQTVVVSPLLSLRYHVKTVGLDEVRAKGNKGILFLSNHPGYIDPIILSNRLNSQFHPRAVMTEDQAKDLGGKAAAWTQNAILVPSIKNLNDEPGATRREKLENFKKRIDKFFAEMTAALENGENLILYPAGKLTRGDGVEHIDGKASVDEILNKLPDTRVVLVDNVGLRGSSFAYDEQGNEPSFGGAALNGVKATLANGLFFNPRREVTLTFTEPADLPRHGSKADINGYLERHWAKTHPEPVQEVPYSWFWNWKPPARLPAKPANPEAPPAPPAADEKKEALP